jgi:hypothetical protein
MWWVRSLRPPPFKQYQALGPATAGFPTFMNSGGSIKGLPTVVAIAP